MESKNKEVDVAGVIDASGFVTANARRVVNAGGYCTDDTCERFQRSDSNYHKVRTIPCKLNKMPEGKLTSLNEGRLCDLDTPTSSTITSRYYKGIGAHKDNMVLEIWRST